MYQGTNTMALLIFNITKIILPVFGCVGSNSGADQFIPSKYWISVFQFPMISKLSVSSERSRGTYESSSRKNRLHAFL